MNESIISSRYAKAFFMVGTDHKCLDALETDMELLYATVKENTDFAYVLDNPVIKPLEKIDVMHSLLEKRVHPMTLSLVDTLIKNRREFMLPDVAHQFIGLYNESRGIKHARITSAVGLDENEKKQLQEQLNKLFQADVRMVTEVNPDLIGGFVFRIDDQQYDASLSSRLRQMRKALTV